MTNIVITNTTEVESIVAEIKAKMLSNKKQFGNAVAFQTVNTAELKRAVLNRLVKTSGLPVCILADEKAKIDAFKKCAEHMPNLSVLIPKIEIDSNGRKHCHQQPKPGSLVIVETKDKINPALLRILAPGCWIARVVAVAGSNEHSVKQDAPNFSVAITGHRPNKLPCGWSFLPEEDKTGWSEAFVQNLTDKFLSLSVKYGRIRFLNGMALGVDMLSLIAAFRAKKMGAHIFITACIPFSKQATAWPSSRQELWQRFSKQCDEVITIASDPSTAAFQERNKYMVDHTDLLYAVWDGSNSGTGNTVKYAQLKDKDVEIISL